MKRLRPSSILEERENSINHISSRSFKAPGVIQGGNMPKREMDFVPGDFYHIYNKAVANSQLFFEDKNYSFFISRIKTYLLNCADVLAYCLMPNHYHLLIKLNTSGFPTAMGRMAMSYAKAINKVYQRTGHLFQGRYQARFINNHIHLDQVARYIHLNPYKAGLCRDPIEWEKSSYPEYIGVRKIDFIKPRIILEYYGPGGSSDLDESNAMYREMIENHLDLDSRSF